MTQQSSNPIVGLLSERRSEISRLLILTHDHPDPDAMASAWALATLAGQLCGIRSEIVYGGVIGRMENQLMIRLLRIPIRLVKPKDFTSASHLATVDTQPPFQNNCCPRGRRVDIVIDHHPRHKKTKADFMLIDETVGATTTLLAEALLAAGIPFSSRLATALVYGITSETQNLWRETGPRDIAVYRAVFPKASINTLSKIQNPTRPSSFFATLGKTIHNAFIVGRIIGVHLGPVSSQDVVAHMADFLLSHEKVSWSIVTGRYKSRLYVSLRTNNRRAQAGKLLWRLLGSGTSAGGHAMIAGGSISVEKSDDPSAWEATEERMTMDFLHSQGYEEAPLFQYPYQGSLETKSP